MGLGFNCIVLELQEKVSFRHQFNELTPAAAGLLTQLKLRPLRNLCVLPAEPGGLR